MTTQQKAREFTLYKTRSHHRMGGRDNWTVREKGNDKAHPNPHLIKEIFHVIEYSAYQRAVEARDAYAKCMAIALKEGIFANKESVKKQIEETLKELGEEV